MGIRKVAWADIPEEDRDWIDPEAYSEMLDRAEDFEHYQKHGKWPSGAEPVPYDEVLRSLEEDSSP
jgi:hypothetical protein